LPVLVEDWGPERSPEPCVSLWLEKIGCVQSLKAIGNLAFLKPDRNEENRTIGLLIGHIKC
jgi:hypothetical protein